jgi:hypothetical protein
MVASTGRGSPYWQRGNALSIFPESNEQALQMNDDRIRRTREDELRRAREQKRWEMEP